MKTEFLKELGLEQGTIDKIFEEYGKDVNGLKGQVEALTGERDTLKANLEDVQTKLKAFDGVDVDSLKSEIEKLQSEMMSKDDEYKQQLADRDFHDLIKTEIHTARGKNPKAITALLDLDNLKTSKNQSNDIKAAIEALRESDGYLFDASDSGKETPAKISSGAKHNESTDNTMDPFVAAAMKGAKLDAGKDG